MGMSKKEAGVQALRAGLLFASGLAACATLLAYGGGLAVLTDEEINAKYQEMEPKETDYKFEPPPSWGPNLLVNGKLLVVVPATEAGRAVAVSDGDNYSNWVAPLGSGNPVLEFDLGRRTRLDHLVLFSRFTDARGTAGGNNALKTIRIATRSEETGTWEDHGTFAIAGPKGVCFKHKSGGQRCFFVNLADPTIHNLAGIGCRYLRLELVAAHWGEKAPSSWKTSVSVSEVLVFSEGTPN